MGLRSLVNFYEDLRYNLDPGEYPINTPKGGVQSWLHIWNELTQSAGHQLGYANMVGNVPQLTTPLLNYSTGADKDVNGQVMYIPMEFWFNARPEKQHASSKVDSLRKNH